MEALFNYLRDVINDPENAILDIEKLPDELMVFGSELLFYTQCVIETKAFAQALSKGDLSGKWPSRSNEIAAPLKSLHASLKHLTWQAQQIAQGDYTQRVAFMGKFSDAFNTMVEQLAERQKKLEDKIKQIHKKTKSLEQSNLLFTSLMQNVPQQIIVINRKTQEILLMNESAQNEVYNDEYYMDNLLKEISNNEIPDDGSGIEVSITQNNIVRYFNVKTYSFEWENTNAEVFDVRDVTSSKGKIKELEHHAYCDSITQLYNRMFGMLTLDNWLKEKKAFVLIFVDLDRLKYINDEFGHFEGDMYIMNAAKHLKTFCVGAVVCRIGGDEFMLLMPDISYEDANDSMNRVSENLQNDDYLNDKTYSYSLSFGIATVSSNNQMEASEILGIADKRMYENKRLRKKIRAL